VIHVQALSIPFRQNPWEERTRVPGVLVVKTDGPQGDYAHLDADARAGGDGHA